jgi:endonuclease YncB( thermonuclease family)
MTRSRLALCSLPFFMAFLASPCHSEDFTARVIDVLDGDSIIVAHDDVEEEVRLNGIDSPEKNQAYGRKAKEFTSQMVLGKAVIVKSREVDRDGRIVADVVLADGTNLNREVVKVGLAWWFWKYSQDHMLRDLETEARDGKRGLWRDPIPIPPWVFRKIQRKQVPDLSDFQYPGTTPLSVLANKKSRAYRRPDCPGYAAMLGQKNPITFETAQEAEEAGYHAAPDCSASVSER